MMYSEDTYDKIWDYLENNLDPKQELEIEKRIQNDAIFRAEVESCQQTLDGLNYLGGEKYISKILKVKPNPFVAIFKNPKSWGIAAGVLLFAGVAGWYMLTQQETNTLADKPTTNSTVQNPENSRPIIPQANSQDLLAAALLNEVKLTNQEFRSVVAAINGEDLTRADNALAAIRPTPTPDPSQDDNLFGASPGAKGTETTETTALSAEQLAYKYLYQGIVAIKKGSYQAALKQLANVRLDQPKKEANWFMALAYLGLDNPDKAKERLHMVANDDENPYQSQAESLLTSME